MKVRLGWEKWEDVFTATDLNSKYQLFTQTLQYYINIACPENTKKIDVTSKQDWITEEISFKQVVSNALKDWQLSKSEADKSNYIPLKKQYRNLIKNTKKQHFSKVIFHSTNPTIGAWKVINKNRPGKQAVS